jgi:hypothetical protein
VIEQAYTCAEQALTNAQKQARYRAKQAQDADTLRGLLYALEQAVWSAADRGDVTADKVKATTYEQMIERLTRHFEDVRNSPLRVCLRPVWRTASRTGIP